jgi:two-component system chemotaxis response regulator CheY
MPRILLVTDNSAIVAEVAGALQSAGHQLEWVTPPELFARFEDDFDALVVDAAAQRLDVEGLRGWILRHELPAFVIDAESGGVTRGFGAILFEHPAGPPQRRGSLPDVVWAMVLLDALESAMTDRKNSDTQPATSRSQLREHLRGEILLVDDDPDIREVVSATLEREGYVVHTARDGHEALFLLRSGIQPALILLDLMMPAMNGWELRRKLREDARFAEIPIAVISAAAAPQGGMRETDTFLRKPFEMSALLRTIESFARRGR